jgi:hypothetical protein
MLQMARHLTDAADDILVGRRYLVLDRDTKYGETFRAFLAREGIEIIRLPRRSPNLKADAERWVSKCSQQTPIEADPDRVGDAAPCSS